jgi:hypothetical protein
MRERGDFRVKLGPPARVGGDVAGGACSRRARPAASSASPPSPSSSRATLDHLERHGPGTSISRADVATLVGRLARDLDAGAPALS